MKGFGLVLLGCIGLFISGCNALDGKCDYLPPNCCGCSNNPFEPSYYSANCRTYRFTQAALNQTNCGDCLCKNDTCSNCWSCGYNRNFHDL